MISPKEAAQAIYGAGMDTKKRVEKIRNELDKGTWPYMPGARKQGKRWMIPIAALGQGMDFTSQPEQPGPVVLATPAGRRSKHSSIGPRLFFQRARANEIWLDLFHELDALTAEDQANALAAMTPLPTGTRSGRF